MCIRDRTQPDGGDEDGGEEQDDAYVPEPGTYRIRLPASGSCKVNIRSDTTSSISSGFQTNETNDQGYLKKLMTIYDTDTQAYDE